MREDAYQVQGQTDAGQRARGRTQTRWRARATYHVRPPAAPVGASHIAAAISHRCGRHESHLAAALAHRAARRTSRRSTRAMVGRRGHGHGARRHSDGAAVIVTAPAVIVAGAAVIVAGAAVIATAPRS